jgi:putative FmdB family regulatory protein
MPTYDYECPKGHRFEVFQRMSDRPVATCPKCKARARRVISGGAGFLFKGEGFYITDYRSEDYKKKASAETGSASDKTEKPEKTEKAAKGKSEGAGGKESPKHKAAKAADS